jgi:hypothetical protein
VELDLGLSGFLLRLSVKAQQRCGYGVSYFESRSKDFFEISRVTAQHDTVGVDKSITNAKCKVGKRFVVEVVFVGVPR